MTTSTDYKSHIKPTWCVGCGDYGVLNAVQVAAAALSLDRANTVVVSGIGCSSDLPHFMSTYGIHTLHGRAMAVAQGVKMANKDLTVIVTGGDGDGYGIGVGHFIHAMRRNINLTYLVMDNQIYGLTTGQTSPTSARGVRTKSTPMGSAENALNPLALAITGGATFVARGFSGEPVQLAELVRRAIAHKGFSLVDVFSPCVTWNKNLGYEYIRPRMVKLSETDHDSSSVDAALKQALRDDGKLPLGILYETDCPIYEEEETALKQAPLVKSRLGLQDEEWKALVQEFL
jgi:2-oxoglutarate/2-oxoacid ferredoxin oxidoreductase subunit beta